MEESGQAERARYIASMCQELAKLAEQSGFDTGAYLLKMASLEFANSPDFPKQGEEIRPNEMTP